MDNHIDLVGADTFVKTISKHNLVLFLLEDIKILDILYKVNNFLITSLASIIKASPIKLIVTWQSTDSAEETAKLPMSW